MKAANTASFLRITIDGGDHLSVSNQFLIEARAVTATSTSKASTSTESATTTAAQNVSQHLQRVKVRRVAGHCLVGDSHPQRAREHVVN